MSKTIVEVPAMYSQDLKELQSQIKGNWRQITKTYYSQEGSFDFLPPDGTSFFSKSVEEESLIYHTKNALFVCNLLYSIRKYNYKIHTIFHPVTYSPDDNFGEKLEDMPFKSLIELKSFPEIVFFPDIMTQNINGIDIPYADYGSPTIEVKPSRIKQEKNNVKKRYKEEMLKATIEFGKRNPQIPKKDLVYEMMVELDLPEEELWYDVVTRPNPDFRSILQASKPIDLRFV